MAEAIYLWLKDSGGADIKGGAEAKSREGSIEVLAYEHDITLPVDSSDGKITARRVHGVFQFMKQLDISTPLLLRSVTDGKPCQSAEFKWYRIDDQGNVEAFYTVRLDKVKVVKVTSKMHDIKDPAYKTSVHMEHIELRYEKITWIHADGNIQHSDSWQEPKVKTS